MFDRSRLPPDSDLLQDLDGTNKAIADMRSILRETVPLGTDMVTMLHELAECYFQAHIRRALQFLDGGMHALDAGYGLIALACARSLYESAACVKDFADRVRKLMDDQDVPGAAKFMIERTLAKRFEVELINSSENNFKAVNVLTQIDAMEKYVPNARRAYEQLSEAAHPNALGAFTYFEQQTDETFVRFGNGKNHEGIYAILVGSASLFGLMRDAYLQVSAGYAGSFAHELQERIDDYERGKHKEPT